MSGGVVCYVERTPGGDGIRRLRLIAAGLARQWTAPDADSVSSVDPGASTTAGGHGVNAARAGATWVAESLEAVGLKRLAAICVDAEGSVCTWLSAPSGDPTAIRDTIAAAGADGESASGVGAARLLTGSEGLSSGASGNFMAEASVQALATLDPEEPSKKKLALKRAAPVPLARKQRFAVLSVQDAIVRVLIDELDARGVEVERVVSIWHAMASGWDGAQPASISDRLVSAASTGGAVILVEPSGRLVWAWTRAGELIAGGAMRLAAHAKQARTPGSSAAAPDAPRDSALATIDPASLASESDDAAPVTLEFSKAEAGRLALDWLSWSAQLGHCPQRVVCLSTPAIADTSPDRPLGPEALFSHLAQLWPGATVDGAVHEDPVGATIGRLAGLGPETRKLLPDEVPASALLPYHARPREALTALSQRPGRADRRLYQWIGVALIAAAALVGVVGFKIRASISAAEEQLAAARTRRTDALKAAEKYADQVSRKPNPEKELQAALDRKRDQAKALKQPRPMIEEAVRMFAALADVNANVPAPAAPTGPATPGQPPAPIPGRTQVIEMDFSVIACSTKLSVPDASTGPDVLEKLNASPWVLKWEGNTTGGAGAVAGGNRNYVLTATWPDNLTPKPRKSDAPAATLKPDPKAEPADAPKADTKPDAPKADPKPDAKPDAKSDANKS